MHQTSELLHIQSNFGQIEGRNRWKHSNSRRLQYLTFNNDQNENETDP